MKSDKFQPQMNQFKKFASKFNSDLKVKKMIK